ILYIYDLLPSSVSFTLWQAALLRYLSGYVGWPVPLTPKAKRYFLRVTIVGGNAHEEILLRCAQKSNHLTNHTDCLRVNSL
ncbi:hypothetical protein, partial [Escherichia coli]|uniref:hypothetical protein n=1 Tax=Escherichia coli TaxID=562 RepID=UPI00207B8EF6